MQVLSNYSQYIIAENVFYKTKNIIWKTNLLKFLLFTHFIYFWSIVKTMEDNITCNLYWIYKEEF